jgi:hypothetical protein
MKSCRRFRWGSSQIIHSSDKISHDVAETSGATGIKTLSTAYFVFLSSIQVSIRYGKGVRGNFCGKRAVAGPHA